MVPRLLLLLALLIMLSTVGRSQQLSEEQRLAVTSGAMGTEFWIAIPPNEINPFPVTSLEVYLVSPYDTDVYIYDAAAGRELKRSLTANTVRTLSDATGETNWTWEIREYEQVVRRGIRLRSDKPFCVSVLNGKVTTSDAFLALPTAMWDTAYIATTYYDFKEVKPWAGGFTIVAGEDNTDVRIWLHGAGETQGRTSAGRFINSNTPIDITMNAGDVYTVLGDGSTRGVFDLTGSRIKSTKPVGFISSHQRTTMPNLLLNGNGRDHLVEMNAPVSQWDTVDTSVEIERNPTIPNAKGDVFRVVAAEDDTRWTLTYYDPVSKTQIGQGGGVLQAGEFADLSQSQTSTILTHGVSIWKADKPIQVVQYSCSSSFDGDQVHDPFQINLLPRDRYVHATTFNTPTDTKFSEHYVTLIFDADPNDAETIERLKKATIDGETLWNHPRAAQPGLISSNIPGTTLWWTRLEFNTSAEAHSVLSKDVPFGGYLYGFGAVDSYGLPLGPIHANNVAIDTAKPAIALDDVKSGSTTVMITEKTNIPEVVRNKPLATDQVDAGIALVELLEPVNFRLVTVKQPGQRRVDATEGEYRIDVIDTTKDASGVLYALDYAGNIRYQQVEFVVPRFPVLSAPTLIDLGETGVDTAICTTNQLVLTNTGNVDLVVSNVEVMLPTTGFTVNTEKCPMPLTIPPGGSRTLDCVCFVASASGTYGASLQVTANDQEEPHLVVLSARVRESVTVAVSEEPAFEDITAVVESDGSITVRGMQVDADSWALSTIQGSIVASGAGTLQSGGLRLPTSHLGNGVYVLLIKTGTEVASTMVALTR